MSEKYKVGDAAQPHFITSTVINWVDVFTRPVYNNIILDSLAYCQKEKGLILYAWVIMTNHIHLIASADANASLSSIMRDFKKFTSRKIIEALKIMGRKAGANGYCTNSNGQERTTLAMNNINFGNKAFIR